MAFVGPARRYAWLVPSALVDTPRKVSATRVRAVAVTDNVVFAVSVGRPRDPIGPSKPERSSQLAERDKSIFLLFLSYFLNARATQVTEE